MRYSEAQLEAMTKEELKAVILEHQAMEACTSACADGFKDKLIEFNKQVLVNYGVSTPIAAVIATTAVTVLFNLYLLLPLLNK